MKSPIAFEREHGERVLLDNPDLIVVGYSARDEEKVGVHIRELQLHGIDPPSEIPSVWHLDRKLLSMDPSILVNGNGTSGEVEPVLIFSPAGKFVTVGSDHTDRDIEKTSMADAKAACPKVVARRCWTLDEIVDDWDALEVASKIKNGSAWRPYQRDRLAALRPIDWFLERFDDLTEAVVFMGTVSLTTGMDTNAEAFHGELVHPSRDRLEFQYQVIRNA